jgi:hypothetical protein
MAMSVLGMGVLLYASNKIYLRASASIRCWSMLPSSPLREWFRLLKS